MEAVSLPLLANKKHVRTNYCLCPTWYAFFEAHNFSIGTSSWAHNSWLFSHILKEQWHKRKLSVLANKKHLDTNYCLSLSHLACVLWGTQSFHWSSSVGIMECTRSRRVLRSATNVLRRLSQLPKRNPPMLRRSPFQQTQRIEVEKRGGRGEIYVCRYVGSENVEFMQRRQAGERRAEGGREGGRELCVAMANRDVWLARERVWLWRWSGRRHQIGVAFARVARVGARVQLSSGLHPDIRV